MDTYYKPEDLEKFGTMGEKHRRWEKSFLIIMERYLQKVR